jgi:hypothetical protein
LCDVFVPLGWEACYGDKTRWDVVAWEVFGAACMDAAFWGRRVFDATCMDAAFWGRQVFDATCMDAAFWWSLSWEPSRVLFSEHKR